ncbi:HNH endonuclease [Leptospira sanjuanensis]|uniref:HNH endonuclease n=1 Tax=Leptospira sanjuanensis TaxID=2879643 RepID=UPI001EE8A151|nr:HNH endonuclease [Leptospira sanjuanensis]MCG6170146.1 HNH endonuclease [Leptospira sanjuanensis]
MAITLKRQLNDEEKNIILNRHGRHCFATGHLIPDSDSLHYDHIFPFSKGGESELDNIAPMCEFHNKSKGTLSLNDYRIKIKMDEFFELGDRLTLKDLLKYLKGKDEIASYGNKISIEKENELIRLSSHSYSGIFPLQKCPLTSWEYFYGNLPVEILNSDDGEENSYGLQPRYLISTKVFDMYRHFQSYPVLQPSIGRISNDSILLFDGQHKAAALLWNNRKIFECKIYLNPEISKLNQANISAHDKFAQTRFFSSIMILKLGSQFGNDFEEYKSLDDGNIKNEINFLNFIRQRDESLSTADINKRFKNYLYNSILEDENNKLKRLISVSNRSSKDQPLTIDMITKSYFACFLHQSPLSDDMLSENYKRDIESKNLISLMNLTFDLSLSNWNADLPSSDLNQTKLNRIFSSKSIMAWMELFKDAVAAKLEIHDSDEKDKIFYREISDTDFTKIKSILERLFNWQIWSAPIHSDIDTQIAGTKSNLKDWFRNKGLTTGFLLGAPI